nr:hypothetical protein Iba_chr15dCG8190 [Ipomoea batatas]
MVGNESDIVLLNVTLLSIALKTRGGSNVDGAGINIDFAILVRIVLTTMRGIKPEFSLSARNNSTKQCVFEYGFLES